MLIDEQIVEDILSLEEISKITLGRYIDKATDDFKDKKHIEHRRKKNPKFYGGDNEEGMKNVKRGIRNRIRGIAKAYNKLGEQKEIIENILEELEQEETIMESSRKLIDSILSGNAMNMENEFNSIMAEKVASKLEDFRKEVGQSMFNESTEPTDEQILEDIQSLFEFASDADKALFQYVKNTSRSFKGPKKSLKDRILKLIKGKSKLTKEQVEFIETTLSESEELDELKAN